GHWAEQSISRAAAVGLVSGNPDGTFNPDGTLTRAAFVKMIVRALDLPGVTPQTPTFPDTAGHWVVTQGFMEAAVQAGLVTFEEFGGVFAPDKPITREEIAVMAARALGEKSDYWDKYPIAGTDAAEITPWRAPYASAVQYLKIITGFPDGSFRPLETATRAQAAVIVLRVVDYRAAHP
ncbi:MAG TPA: S-layer homology domain-containing protein, partial [Symbiobacteriaceae bacterium]|nr:S-layer homology domain-containing protein [Symbiobacteriaceae bacterium]